MVPQFRPQAALHLLERFLHAPRGGAKEGGELTPLLPSDAALAGLGDEDFEAAMDEWTERAMAAADAGRGAARGGGEDATLEIEECADACLAKPRSSPDRASLDGDVAPQRVLPVALEGVVSAKATEAATSLQVFSNVHFLLLVGGVLLGMALSHYVARRSAWRRREEACPSPPIRATEATPLRKAGVLC